MLWAVGRKAQTHAVKHRDLTGGKAVRISSRDLGGERENLLAFKVVKTQEAVQLPMTAKSQNRPLCAMDGCLPKGWRWPPTTSPSAFGHQGQSRPRGTGKKAEISKT